MHIFRWVKLRLVNSWANWFVPKLLRISYRGKTVMFRFDNVNVCSAVEPLVMTVAALGPGRHKRLVLSGLAIVNLGICLRFNAGNDLSVVSAPKVVNCLINLGVVMVKTLKADNRIVCKPELSTCFSCTVILKCLETKLVRADEADKRTRNRGRRR